jgi:hypothetical protein
MSELSEREDLLVLLATMELRLNALGADIERDLLPGLSEDEIRAMWDLPYSLSPEVIAWFSWHNGANMSVPTTEWRGLPFGQPLSLAGALESRAVRLNVGARLDASVFKPQFLPIVSESQWGIVLDLTGEAHTPVLEWDLMASNVATQRTKSLFEFVTLVGEALDAGVWSMGDAGDWIVTERGNEPRFDWFAD